MEKPITVCFRHKADGELLGEIRNDKGQVVASRSFGVMDEEEYNRCLNHIERIFPGVCRGPRIELTGN